MGDGHLNQPTTAPANTARRIGAVSIRATASIEEQERYGHCFACGAANDSGLNLEFDALDDGSVTALYAPQERYQGWPNVLHGGIVATLLDEAAAYVAYARGQHAATARLTIRYSRPAPLDAPLRVTATLVKDTRRMLTIEARVTTLEDEKIATAEATLLLLTAKQEQEYGLIPLTDATNNNS